MVNLQLKILIFLSFLITPLSVLVFPEKKDFIIATIEMISEGWLCLELSILNFYKAKSTNVKLLYILLSVIFLFLGDTLNSARLLGFTQNFVVLSDVLYSGFASFILLFLVLKLELAKIKLKEWILLFFVIMIVDCVISYHYLLAPYYTTNPKLILKISGTVYMAITIIIFSLLLSFSFRVIDRKDFWLLNFLILAFTSDFAIRYQDALSYSFTFSWGEIGWSSTFLGLAWLLHLSKITKDSFFGKPLSIAPLISIRSLLTLFIYGANCLLILGIFTFKLFSIQNAIDISSISLLVFILWTIINEFSIWLANDLSNALDHMFKSKKHLTSKGMIQFNLENVTTQSSLFEISNILGSYNELANQTNIIMATAMDINKKAAMAEVACQVSHDVQSPLAALDMAVSSLTQAPENLRVIIRSSIGRIKDISSNLLRQNPKVNLINDSDHILNEINEQSTELLPCIIEKIISEKRMQFRLKFDLEIYSVIGERSHGLFVKVNSIELMRVLSNIINNAVESIHKAGRVIIKLSQTHDFAVISIKDDGIGIPQEHIKFLGQRDISFGKKEGHGLGLYHAKNAINSWGGDLKISSTIGEGTIVDIELPLAKSPAWFVDNVFIFSNSTIVILDDDLSIHQIWDDRFGKINDLKHNLEVIHFSTLEQIYFWVKSRQSKKHTLFLIDYELMDNTRVGLDIIKELRIQKDSYLVTSRYEEASLRFDCEQNGIKIIPKDIAAFIPLTIIDPNNVNIVLIDDDELIRLSWSIAANEAGINIITYSSPDEFEAKIDEFNSNTVIYLDSKLSNGVKGEQYAKELYNKGFSEIHLATGYSNKKFENMPWIKTVTGKTPPFSVNVLATTSF